MLITNLTHTMFGWMTREDADAGEIYEPKTVKQKMKLASASNCVTPVIFDLKNRKFIWCDIISNDNTHWYPNNLENNLSSTAAICYSMVNNEKPDLYTLFMLHASSRGTLVDNKEDADIIFDVDGDVTPFDFDIIISEYLK